MKIRKANGSRPGFGMIEVFVIIAIIAFLIAVLMPAAQVLRQAATRTQSINNLKQIGLAFHNYHDTYKRFPCNGSDAKRGNTQYKAIAETKNENSGSWGFQILPFIEQNPAFQAADRKVEIAVYMCPGRGRPKVETSNGGGAWTDYFMNHYITTDATKPDSLPKYNLGNIPDGSSNTVGIGQGAINTKDYMSDKDVAFSTNIFQGGTTGTIRAGHGKEGTVTLARDSDKAPTLGSWGGPFQQGALIGMWDGSVRVVPYGTKDFRVFLIPDSGIQRPVID